MGFFSVNEHSNLSGRFEFPDIEGYCGTIGCGAAIVEGYQNDWALFEAQVYSDMHEMAILKEGGDIVALQEASLKGMWEAIKQFFIKLGAKIKAIFKAFCAKLESYFTKDLKGFVKKYEKSLDGKDFKDMKVKFGEVKKGRYTADKDPYPVFDEITVYTSDDKKDYDPEKFDRSDTIEGYYKEASNNAADDSKSFDQWYHESLYEDEEVHDNLDPAKVRAAAGRLTANTKLISEIDKASKSVLKTVQKTINNIDKEAQKITKLYSDPGTKNDRSGKLGVTSVSINFSKNKPNEDSIYSADEGNGDPKSNGTISDATNTIQIIRSKASCYQEVVMHITQTIMKEAKYGIAQDKKVFTAAVAYKKSTSEATLLEMIAECAADEVDEYFNNTRVIA